MKYKVALSILLTVCLSFSCKQYDKQIQELLEKFIGTQVTIPEDLLLFNNTSRSIKKDAKYKIVFYINSLDCTLCYLNQHHSTWVNLSNIFKD